MADVKHTQWSVFATPEDPDFACEVTSAGGEVAAVYEHPDAVARARLIAAAPALLEARNELVTAIHTLASHFENTLHNLNHDREALAKAKGDIAHAMKIAAKHNANGAARATEGSV